MRRKNIIGIGLLAMLLAFGSTVAGQELGRPRVAVVLSGGGAKGVAHISALRTIEEAGIPVDIVCGTSMGALIGGLYSIGYSPDELDSLVRCQDWPLLLSDRDNPELLNLEQRHWQNSYAVQYQVSSRRHSRPTGGLIRGGNLADLFTQLCSGYLDSIDFNSLPRKYACVATDIVNNIEVDFRSGDLRQAMRASMAIPGVFTPVRMNDMVLVDGGLRNNFPADLARALGADIIIGVSVQGELPQADELTNAMAVLGQIIDINCKNKYDDNLALSDVMVMVPVEGYTAASFTPDAIDTLLRRGREATMAHWDELLALRRSRGIDSVPPRRIVRPHSDAAPPAAQRRIDLSPTVMAGFRFDSEELGALLVGASIPFVTPVRSHLDLRLRLGKRVVAGAEFSSPVTAHPTLAYTFSREEQDIYNAGKRSYNVKYRHHQADVIPLNFKLSRLNMRIGVRWDYYNYYGRILTAGQDLVDLSSENYFSYRAELTHSTENHWYFPTRGWRIEALYAYRTSNLVGLDGQEGLSDLSARWRLSVPVARGLSIQPMISGRMLFGPSVPLVFRNAIGGEWSGHYVEQQMPFAGIGHMEIVDNLYYAACMQLQQRIGKNHYVFVSLAAGRTCDLLENLLNLPDMFGGQVGYSYSTILGPIDVRLGYSNRTHGLNLLLNLGHVF